MSKQEAKRLADALEKLHDSKAPHIGSPRGQMLGMEDYRLIASGLSFGCMIEAAALLRQWPDGKLAAYQYLYEGTYGPVWRNDDALWNGQKPKASRQLYTAPHDQSARIAELEQEVSAWRATTNDAHDYHRAAMVELSNILGVKDPENEPRFKWVALQASKVVERISELEAQRLLASASRGGAAMTPKLPPPKHLRRQQRKDGGYDMVPAYTAEETQAYGIACWKQGMWARAAAFWAA